MKIWNDIKMDARPRVRYWVPAAAMDEGDLRADLRRLRDRGFGGVEVVVLQLVPPEVLRSERGWGTGEWDRISGILNDETKKLGMSLDFAIGPGWPMGSPAVRDADDPAALYELTWGVLEVSGSYNGPLPERRKTHDEGTPHLLHVLAYRETGVKTLYSSSYIDLRPYVSDGVLRYDFPEGRWLIFAFWEQPAVQKINAGMTYTIDHLSRAGVEAVEAYWEKALAENDLGHVESLFCDSLEYEVALDWTPDMLREFETRRGYSLLPYLPLLGMRNSFPACDPPLCDFEDVDRSERIRSDYREVLTELYCEYHLAELERFAERHGKTIRYQVAYNKQFEPERCGLYVAIPENEALGRAAVDCQKIMAAAAHLGRKARYSFECAAEFGYTYSQEHDDLFWWIKRSLMAGMNAQVLHGASYSGATDIPGVEWPGYEGFSRFVSNEWGRTLDGAHTRGVLDAAARLNTVFRLPARVDIAVYHGEYSCDGKGDEYYIYPDGGLLSRLGYSYEFLSEKLLSLDVCTVRDGRLDPDGVRYRALVLPEQRYASRELLQNAIRLAESGLPVLFVGGKPSCARCECEFDTEEKRREWASLLERAWALGAHTATLEGVPEALAALGVVPSVSLESGIDIMTATHDGGDVRYCALYANNRVLQAQPGEVADEILASADYKKGTVKRAYSRPGEKSRRKISVSLEGEGRVLLMDPWSGRSRDAGFVPDGAGRMQGTVSIEEDELLLLALDRSEQAHAVPEQEDISDAPLLPVDFENVTLYAFEPNEPGEKSFLRSGFGSEGRIFTLTEPLPWCELSPELAKFSGRGVYRAGFTVLDGGENARAVLELGNVSDTFTVRINGVETPFPDQVLKRADLTGLLRRGRNELEIEVVSTLYNALYEPGMSLGGVLPLPYETRRYGIWASDGKETGVRLAK